MIQIEFNCNQNLVVIQANLEDKFQDVINRYIQKSLLDPNSLYFMANGKQINPEQTVASQISDLNKQSKSCKVLVILEEEEDNQKKEAKVKSDEIICPFCYEPCRIKIENFNLTLFDCVNQHIAKNITLKDFPENQKINVFNILCDKCKLKKFGDSPNNEFFICLTCKKYLCLLCKPKHEVNHKIINYKEKNYICQTHNEHFIKYCKECNKNICFSCDEEHKEHQTLFLGDLKPNMEETKNKIVIINKEIDSFNNKIKGIIKQLKELMEIINTYKEIYSNILNIYEKQNRNYQILQNIKEIDFDNEIFKTINRINQITDVKGQLSSIFNLYKNLTENLEAPTIGIDLGISNNSIAVFQNGQAEIIPDEIGQRSSPSYVAFTDSKKLFGESAKNSRNPTNTIYNIKRLIGLNFNSEQVKQWQKFWPFKLIEDKETGRLKILVDYKNEKKTFFLEEILAIEFQKIKQKASKYLGKEVKNAVISVPNCFNTMQRQLVKDAAAISGLNVQRAIGEPILASYEDIYISNNKNERNVIIFDLGAGFLNAALMVLEDGMFEVRSVNGLSVVGGEDFTNRLIDYCVKDFEKKTSLNIMKNPKAFRRLRIQCEKAKITLSSAKQVTIDLEAIMDDKDLYIQINRDKFEELCEDLFQKCIRVIDNLLLDGNINKEKIDEIFLIGASSRIPKIQSMLQEYFNGKKINRSLNPNEAVALGAAIQGAIITNVKNEKIERIVLMDVLPFSIGIETKGGAFSVLIPRNSTIPCKKIEIFSTYEDNQSSVLIQIYEGECKLAKDNCLIAKLNFEGLPPGPKGSVFVYLTLDILPNFNINLIATEKTTKKELKMTIDYEKYRIKKELREKLTSEYKKEFEINQNLERIDSKLEKIFENTKHYCNASIDEIVSKKEELINIFEKFYQEKWLIK